MTASARLHLIIFWTWSLLVVAFLIAPVIVVAVLAFNTSPFGTFPIEGFGIRWFIELADDPAIMSALGTSLILAAASAAIATVVGVAAALSIARYTLPGRKFLAGLIIAPLLVPEVVLAVGVLLFLRWLGLSRNFGLLLCGHVLLVTPYVFTVVLARLGNARRDVEEAARCLGAGAISTFVLVTLPMILPSVVAGFLFAFTVSFDDVTATLFWKSAGTETLPTQIVSMLRNSISPEVNAVGTLMVIITLLLPLTATALARRKVIK
jgi:spermidine/putrescine transport system permease protein